MSAADRDARKAVYTVVDRDGGKSRWVRIGIAFTNRDGSLNVILDSFPVNGRLHIREFAEHDAAEPGA